VLIQKNNQPENELVNPAGKTLKFNLSKKA